MPEKEDFWAWAMALGIVVSTAFFFALLIVFFDSFVIWNLWTWFVAKPFEIRALTIWEAMGLGLLVTYMTYHYYPFKREEERKVAEIFFYAVVRPAVTLVLGWVVHFLV